MKIADEYFNKSRETVARHPELMGRKVRYQDFTRNDGIVIGCNKSVNFIRENTYGPGKISGLKDGDRFMSGEPVLTVEGYYEELVTLETTRLGFLSFSGAATNMREIVKAADGVPIIDMSARHYPWQIIEEVSLAAYIGGAVGTSTKEGHDYVQKWYNPGDDFKCYASLPHAQAAILAEMAEKKGFFPSVMAAILFHETYPDDSITVLVDYEGLELNVTKQAFEILGDKLFAVRLDTHGGRPMQGVSAPQFFYKADQYFKSRLGVSLQQLMKENAVEINTPEMRYYYGYGVTIEATYRMRDFLDEIGARDTKIVVSSGFNNKKVQAFRMAQAPMDFIGTGSWVDFMMFTSDISHVWEKGEWKFRTKVGRIHGPQNGHKVLFERK